MNARDTSGERGAARGTGTRAVCAGPRRGASLHGGGRARAGLRAGVAAAALVAAVFPGVRGHAREEAPLRYALVVVHLHSLTDSEVADLGVRIPVPVTNEYQQILDVQFAPEPSGFEPVPEGGRLAFFGIPRMAPRQAAWVWMLVRCRLLAYQPRRVRTPRPLPQDIRRRCLQPSRLVDSDAPAIQSAAQEIAAGAAGPWDTARRINRYMVGRISYEMDSEQLSASAVLNLGRGSCSELARLYVALARAAGLPARLARGSRLRADRNGYVDCVHHCWAEIYLDDYGWFPVDPRINCTSPDPEERFGKLPAQYLTLLRIPGRQEDSRFSAQLSMVDKPEAVRDWVRTYWFDASAYPLWEMMKRLGPGDWPAEDAREVRRQILALRGTLAVPFVSMALYEPLAAANPGRAIRALAKTEEPAAVVPLVDFLETMPGPEAVQQALEALGNLTGQRFGTAAEWRSWLWAEGRQYLRGTSQESRSAE